MLIWLVAVLLPAPAWADANDLVDAVKAAYLYKLPDFITWPAAPAPAATFIICVIGESPLARLLVPAVSGQTVQQRPIVIRQFDSIVANPGCQLMFIAGVDTQTADNILAAVRGTPVLTVTDGQSDDNAAGIINFVMQGNYVRFEINLAQAAENRLIISSKLLSLALAVRDARNLP
jgi:hypothetical protein